MPGRGSAGESKAARRSSFNVRANCTSSAGGSTKSIRCEKNLRIGVILYPIHLPMAFSLASLSETFSKMFSSLSAKDSESFVGVDIGSSSIKIAQVRQVKGAAVLETYGEIALGPYGNAEVGQAASPSPEKVAEALADVVKAANVTAKSGGFSIPLSGSLISVI